jgi:excisionase family DNA binding protein
MSNTQMMKPEEVARYLQLKIRTFYKLAKSGEIPGAIKIGGSWRIDKKQLDAAFRRKENR